MEITPRTTNEEIYEEVQDYYNRLERAHVEPAFAGEFADEYCQQMFQKRTAARQAEAAFAPEPYFGFRAEYEAALATARRYEATGDVRVFGGR